MAKTRREEFIYNTVYNTGFKLLNQLIALLLLPLFIKNLGTELYGIWIISGIVIGYLEMVDLGFSEGVMREVSKTYVNKDFDGFRKVINSSFILFLVIGLCIFLLIYIFKGNIVRLLSVKNEDIAVAQKLLLISGIFAPLLWATRITNVIYQGILRFKEYSIWSGIQSLARVLTMLVLLYMKCDILTIVVATNVVFLLLWIPSLITLFKVCPEIKFDRRLFSLKVLSKIAPFSLAVFYAQLISMLALQADNLIIGIAISMTGVTAYTVASKLFYTSYTYMGMVSGVFQPTSYKAFAEKDQAMIEKLMYKGTKYMTMLYTPIGYLGIIISPLFIETWVGKEFVGYSIWSQLFMAVFVLTSGFGLPVNLVFNSGKTRPANIFKTVVILTNLAIGIATVKHFGIGGPIIGTLVAGMIGPFTFPYFCRLLNIPWKSSVIMVVKIVLINLPVSILFYWLSTYIEPGWFNLMWFASAIIIAFSLILYLFFFDDDERRDAQIFLKMFSFKNKTHSES